MELSSNAATAAEAIFTGQDAAHPPCIDCGGVHIRACPRIKRVRTVVDPKTGVVIDRDVEYWPANGPWETGIVFFDDLDV